MSFRNSLQYRVALSDEQQKFIEYALQGDNILVDACIGSGKTTAIQHLCDELPTSKQILYLTYNKLLKLDARSKILNYNVLVTNYHGFAWSSLNHAGLSVNPNNSITQFLQHKPPIAAYDVLIIDEYQDIETDHSLLLEYIKSQNPDMQIIAVGDMQQKIYNKTTLNVEEFIYKFLGEHTELEFTQCFRLGAELAAKLGRIWNKNIVGVNENCQVLEMTVSQVVQFIAQQRLGDLLCLGSRAGKCSDVLNYLETYCYDKFNKNTVYASIRENDSLGVVAPNENTAIFTTFDSSKGLERPVCVLFDYTEDYWLSRIGKPGSVYEILRNIFCVAASRGKYCIVFVRDEHEMLSEQTLATPVCANTSLQDVGVCDMFDFKFVEDILAAYQTLDIKEIEVEDNSTINVPCNDGLIDLSRCIGMYQEAVYFKQYNIDKQIELFLRLHTDYQNFYGKKEQGYSLQKKILFYTSLCTNQKRYITQVSLPIVNDEVTELIKNRLATRLDMNECIQVPCELIFGYDKLKHKLFTAHGFADVVKDDVVYELKFVNELTYEHFLQCACYMVSLGLEKGILWNVKKNTVCEIRIPDTEDFINKIITVATKHRITRGRLCDVDISPLPPLDSKNAFYTTTDTTKKDKPIKTQNDTKPTKQSKGRRSKKATSTETPT